MNKGILIALLVLSMSACNDGSDSGGSGAAVGVAGSTARFSVIGDYLYAISGSQLQLFDIRDPAVPNPWSRVQLEWDIETLFPYGDHLLVGSQSGVHILENSDPGSPQYVTEFVHGRSCDPVVAEDDIAYVTLRGGNSCGVEAINQLDVLDIADFENPELVRSYPMQAPRGLAVDGQYLFVCDDVAGLKVFDTTAPDALSVLDVVADVNCFDVIAKDQRLYVSVNDRLLQYDYTELPLTKISELSVAAQ